VFGLFCSALLRPKATPPFRSPLFLPRNQGCQIELFIWAPFNKLSLPIENTPKFKERRNNLNPKHEIWQRAASTLKQESLEGEEVEEAGNGPEFLAPVF
jgi:hypothetical protein